MLSHPVVTNHTWLFKFKSVQIKWGLGFRWPVMVAPPSAILAIEVWPVATILDSIDRGSERRAPQPDRK